jgi:hypothetical protein
MMGAASVRPELRLEFNKFCRVVGQERTLLFLVVKFCKSSVHVRRFFLQARYGRRDDSSSAMISQLT